MYRTIYNFLEKNELKEDLKAISYYKSLGYSEKISLLLGLINYNSSAFKYMKDNFKLTPENFCDIILDDIMKKISENENAKTIEEMYNVFPFKFGISAPMSLCASGMSSAPKGMIQKNISAVSISDLSNVSLNAASCQFTADEELYEDSIEFELEQIDAQYIRTDKYDAIEEKGFVNVINNPTSTFRTTNNTASMGIVKNNFLKFGKVDKSMVRIEELLNYYNYKLIKPYDNLFEINTEVYTKDNGNKVLFIGIQGNDKIPKKQNIVLLLDRSGSMSGSEKQMQASFFTILSKLSDEDKFSLITYSSTDNTIFETTNKKETNLLNIIYKFLDINIDGCTYGSKGLEAAYKLIEKNKIDNGINRIFILTDGDFNFGLTKNDSIEQFILEKKKTGAYLSIIGTGTYNINDHLMETLSKNGNGNYVYVNSIDDVDESINKNYCLLAYTLAIDVKAQVEFNPRFVESYRLIGYENRKLNHEDFKDDTVISEPFGSGCVSIALYEIIPNNKDTIESELKYQKPILTDFKDLCTVEVRYKNLNETQSVEISKEVIEGKDCENAKFAYLIAMAGEKLRNSKYYEKTVLEDDLLDGKLEDFIKLNDGKIDLIKEFLK